MITDDEVRQIPLFAQLDESTIAQIAAQAADVRLNTGEWVARPTVSSPIVKTKLHPQ